MDTERTKAAYRKQLYLTGIKLLHFLASVLIFFIFWLLFRYGTLHVADMSHTGFRYNFLVLAGYGAVLFFFTRTYNTYLLGYSRIRMLAFSEALAQFLTVVIIYFVVSIGWNHFQPVWALLAMFILQCLVDVLWAYNATGFYFRLNPPKRTILIYRNALDKRRFGSIKGKPSERIYKIEAELCYDGKSFVELRPHLKGYEAVFVAGVDSRCRNGIAKYCKEESIPGFFLPHVGDVIMQEAMHIQSFDSPVLYVTRTVPRPEYAAVKRAFDICASLAGIIVLSPIMLVTAIAIRAYDGGPALYRQVRLTQNGRHFTILKFRSMRVDAEKDGLARISTGANDYRITPIGRIVRKCRLDELPQLFNILKGDMSVVGPRPERPEIAEQYCRVIPDFKLRLQVKAGLTGYAQVYGKYNTDPYEKLEFDLLYINNMNIFTDLRLIFATFSILFQSESTEGIGEGQVTAMDYESRAEEEKTGGVREIIAK